MTSGFHYSETSAFSPIAYDVYEYVPQNSTVSVDVLSPYCEYENRQLQQHFIDQWVTSLYPSNYESGYNVLPYPYLHDYLGEPGFIRKRNERERMRVRNVNEGYARLRDHLPLKPTEKRLSKVETLRGAIEYIRLLETLLKDQCDDEGKQENIESTQHESNTKHFVKKDSVYKHEEIIVTHEGHQSWQRNLNDKKENLFL